jgi:hypothetical protein
VASSSGRRSPHRSRRGPAHPRRHSCLKIFRKRLPSKPSTRTSTSAAVTTYADDGDDRPLLPGDIWSLLLLLLPPPSLCGDLLLLRAARTDAGMLALKWTRVSPSQSGTLVVTFTRSWSLLFSSSPLPPSATVPSSVEPTVHALAGHCSKSPDAVGGEEVVVAEEEGEVEEGEVDVLLSRRDGGFPLRLQRKAWYATSMTAPSASVKGSKWPPSTLLRRQHQRQRRTSCFATQYDADIRRCASDTSQRRSSTSSFWISQGVGEEEEEEDDDDDDDDDEEEDKEEADLRTVAGLHWSSSKMPAPTAGETARTAATAAAVAPTPLSLMPPAVGGRAPMMAALLTAAEMAPRATGVGGGAPSRALVMGWSTIFRSKAWDAAHADADDASAAPVGVFAAAAAAAAAAGTLPSHRPLAPSRERRRRVRSIRRESWALKARHSHAPGPPGFAVESSLKQSSQGILPKCLPRPSQDHRRPATSLRAVLCSSLNGLAAPGRSTGSAAICSRTNPLVVWIGREKCVVWRGVVWVAEKIRSSKKSLVVSEGVFFECCLMMMREYSCKCGV